MATKKKYCDNPNCDIFKNVITTTSDTCRNCGEPLKLYQTYHKKLLIILILGCLVGGVKVWLWWNQPVDPDAQPTKPESQSVVVSAPEFLKKLEEVSKKLDELKTQSVSPPEVARLEEQFKLLDKFVKDQVATKADLSSLSTAISEELKKPQMDTVALRKLMEESLKTAVKPLLVKLEQQIHQLQTKLDERNPGMVEIKQLLVRLDKQMDHQDQNSQPIPIPTLTEEQITTALSPPPSPKGIVTKGIGTTVENPQMGVPINFAPGSVDIPTQYYPLLGEFGKSFQNGLADAMIVIAVHTDNIGSKTLNLRLSEQRAMAIKAFLVSNYQIAEERLTTVGCGEEYPIASNDSEEGRSQNRRVEFIRKLEGDNKNNCKP